MEEDLYREAFSTARARPAAGTLFSLLAAAAVAADGGSASLGRNAQLGARFGWCGPLLIHLQHYNGGITRTSTTIRLRAAGLPAPTMAS